MSTDLDSMRISLDGFFSQPHQDISQLRIDSILTAKGISPVLESILTQADYLELVSQNSYTHKNGFDVLTLLISRDPEYRVRLHIWWPNAHEQSFEHIHNHSWDFTSKVLIGSYRFQIFDCDDEGDEFFNYRVSVSEGNTGHVMTYRGKSRLKSTFDGIVVAGTSYSFSYKPFHRISSKIDIFTVTLMVCGHYQRDVSDIFTNAPVINPEYVPRVPFSSRECKEKIEDCLSRIGKIQS